MVTEQFKELSSFITNVRVFKVMCKTYNLNLHQQSISAENVVYIASQLQAVVSQATGVGDQSAPNLAIVTNVITQIANISLPTTAPVQLEVQDEGAIVFLMHIHILYLIRPSSILSVS